MPTQAAEKLMTAEQFAVFEGEADKVYELIQGVLVEMPRPGARHGKLMSKVDFALRQYVTQHHAGEVLADVGFRFDFHPDTVRAPDVAYLGPDAAAAADDPKFPAVAPAIVVEVNSPHDVMSEVLDKARWWLARGCRQVWVVDDPTRTVTVYLPDNTARILGKEDILVAEDLLPGFALPLTQLFG
jgi:Uma2 family endonuclease